MNINLTSQQEQELALGLGFSLEKCPNRGEPWSYFVRHNSVVWFCDGQWLRAEIVESYFHVYGIHLTLEDELTSSGGMKNVG